MTTAADMIKWLSMLPPEAEIECLNLDQERDLVCIDESIIIDYRSDEDRAKYKNMAGRVIVMLNSRS